MKRVSGYLLGAGLAAVLATGAALAWLGATAEGARWLLAAVSRHSAVRITAARVDGRLLDHLRLKGVRVVSGRLEAEMDGVDLRWRPLFLLGGRIAVKELALQGLRIVDKTPPAGKPPELKWPRLPVIFELMEGKIAALRVKGFSYRRPGSKPMVADSISAAVGWRFRLLSLSDLAILSPSGSMKGMIAAGFATPFLKTNLVIVPQQPAKRMESLSIQARLLPGRGLEQLAGSFAISAGLGSRQRLELSGEAGLTVHSLNLRRLRLTAPGRRGVVSGEGAMDLSAKEPSLKLKLRGRGLDLSQEIGMPTDLSAELEAAVKMDEYRGSFSFANRGNGWRSTAIAGRFRGNGRGMKLTALYGRLLDGAVTGEVGIGWEKGIALSGTISGINLNPARIDPQWNGELNFDLSGKMARQGKGPLNWDLDARLRESRLHGQALAGEFRGGSVAGNLHIDHLLLKGRGFDINGAGELKRRVDLTARINDLSLLVPGTAGKVSAGGWMRWRSGRAAGSISLHGKGLAARGMRADSMDLAAGLDAGNGYPLHLKAKLRNVSSRNLHADTATLAADGTLMNHTLAAAIFADGAEVKLSLSGGYGKGLWQGDIARLTGRDGIGPWEMEGPARLSLGKARVSITPIVIRGVGGERLEVAGELSGEPRRGELRLSWGKVNLARVSRWLKGVRVTGSSSGNLQLSMTGGERLIVAGNATAAGTVTADGKGVTVARSMVKITGNERGIHAALEINTTGGGVVNGTFSSAQPVRPAIPEQGEIALEWKGIDLLLLRPWLPDAVKIDGMVAGSAKGKLLPGRRLDMEGESALSRGSVRWRNPEGEVKLELRSAHVKWGWRGETFSGNAALSLADYGEVRGSFRLPVPARFPVAIVAAGEIQASLAGQLREKGVLSALFPGVIRESSGELNAEMRAGGRWDEPGITGNLRLGKAGAYLPSAGIQVKDVQFSAHLEKEMVRIDSLRASSGPGHLEGSATITLKGRRVTGYRGKIDGENFQTIYFPELQLKSSPHLTFDGTPEKLSVRGEVLLPELLINGPPKGKVIEPSSDVVVEGRNKPAAKGSPVALDVRVRMVLGDNVQVNAAGINAQLAGKMDLTFTTLDRITSKGEIRVVKGSYRTYGVNLDIVRGRLYYAGGPINRPTLDFLALRTIGNVRAGVTVGGVLQAPVTKLYSDPSMADVDKLAYIVLGHPLGSAGASSQTALLAQAAGALLSSSQATDLRGEIKGRLGLSTLGFETGSGATTGSIGYRTIPVAPPGKTPTASTASDSLLTVGKYLTPQLYLSYGRSLFTGGNLFRLRYDIFKHWQVETQTGAESGGDIFYSIEFE